MAAITWSDVLVHAPELSDIDAGAQDDIIEYVMESVDEDKFGGESARKTKLARIYLAAHLGESVKRAADTLGGSAVGQIASMSEGGVSVSFAVSSSNSSLGDTIYGKRYAEIVESSLARFPIVM